MQFFDKFFNTVTVRPNRKLIPELVIDKIKGQGAKATTACLDLVQECAPYATSKVVV